METPSQEFQDQATLFQKPKTDYQIKVNEAAKIISGSKSYLVRKGNRGEQLDLAYKKVAEEGYNSRKAIHDRRCMARVVVEHPSDQSSIEICVGNIWMSLRKILKTLRSIYLSKKCVIQAEMNRNYSLR